MQPGSEMQLIERPIVQQEHTERYGQQIEEGIIAGEKNQNLQIQRQRRTDEAPRTRREKQEWNREFDEQRGGSGETLNGKRQLIHVPGERRRQRLRHVVIRNSGEIAPDGVVAAEFDDARKKHQAEE